MELLRYNLGVVLTKKKKNGFLETTVIPKFYTVWKYALYIVREIYGVWLELYIETCPSFAGLKGYSYGAW